MGSIAEVKNRMKGLKKVIIVAQIDSKRHNPANDAPTVNISTDKVMFSPRKKSTYRNANVLNKRDRISNKILSILAKRVCKEERSIVDTILWWGGVIVIVLIVGTVVIYIIDAIVPKDITKFVQNTNMVFMLCA